MSTANTYDWIIATADSNVNNIICVKIRPIKMKLEASAVWFPSKVINRWPATIFAIRRTDKVRGRITLLIDSISTINGISALGVLCGTKWANIWFVKLIHPYNIKLSQNGRARVRVKVMWLEEVKI